jgi:hypothetical protein
MIRSLHWQFWYDRLVARGPGNLRVLPQAIEEFTFRAYRVMRQLGSLYSHDYLHLGKE